MQNTKETVLQSRIKRANFKWFVVEKDNHYAIHAICDSKDEADNHLKTKIPEYVRNGYFTDKTLTAESFEVIRGEL